MTSSVFVTRNTNHDIFLIHTVTISAMPDVTFSLQLKFSLLHYDISTIFHAAATQIPAHVSIEGTVPTATSTSTSIIPNEGIGPTSTSTSLLPGLSIIAGDQNVIEC